MPLRGSEEGFETRRETGFETAILEYAKKVKKLH